MHRKAQAKNAPDPSDQVAATIRDGSQPVQIRNPRKGNRTSAHRHPVDQEVQNLLVRRMEPIAQPVRNRHVVDRRIVLPILLKEGRIRNLQPQVAAAENRLARLAMIFGNANQGRRKQGVGFRRSALVVEATKIGRTSVPRLQNDRFPIVLDYLRRGSKRNRMSVLLPQNDQHVFRAPAPGISKPRPRFKPKRCDSIVTLPTVAYVPVAKRMN